MNAWTANLGQMLFDAYDRADRDPQCRVVVVTGAGRGFCAGADMGGAIGTLYPGGIPGPGLIFEAFGLVGVRRCRGVRCSTCATTWLC